MALLEKILASVNPWHHVVSYIHALEARIHAIEEKLGIEVITEVEEKLTPTEVVSFPDGQPAEK